MVKRKYKRPAWPRQALVTGAAMLLALFLLPLFFLPEPEEPLLPPQESIQPSTPAPAVSIPPEQAGDPVAVTPVPGWDEGRSLKLLHGDGTVGEITMADYLWGVVAAEMPATFHPEALKAQAVAARTYCLYRSGQGGDKHPQADVCTDFNCCQAYLTRQQAMDGWGEEAPRYADKITAAVADTDGLVCLYDGELIDAVFFSSAPGKTTDAVQVWGKDVPYLVSVDSPEGQEVPGWQTVVTFTPTEFSAKFLAAYPQADFTGGAEGWFGDFLLEESGVVKTVNIGGVTVTGSEVRALFGLRSAHFTAAATGEVVTFQVTGYGHGVGMSQYGANALAGEGKTFEEILTWYYTGVALSGVDFS